jgi:hypothetical protein
MSERKVFFQLGTYHNTTLLTNWYKNINLPGGVDLPYTLGDLRDTQLMRESMLWIAKMIQCVLQDDDPKAKVAKIIEDLSRPAPDITGQCFLPTDQPVRFPTSEFVDWMLEEQNKWT